jgi:DNA-binding CsgD family transcriptional regulator
MFARRANEEQIARELSLAPSTVKTYLRRAREKLGASTRSQAVGLAIQRGLLPDRRAPAAP